MTFPPFDQKDHSMKTLFPLLVLVLLSANVADAAIIGSFESVSSENGFTPPSGFVTSDLAVNASTDWLAANLVLNLTSGSIYQDAILSGFGPPSSALVNAIPSTRFDTYVTGSAGLAGGAPSSAGGAVDLGGSPVSAFDTSKINLNWFTTSTTDIGQFTIGRITLSDDAVGTFSLRLDSLQQTGPFLLSGTIENGSFVAVPELNSIVMVSAVGLVGCGTRRVYRRTLSNRSMDGLVERRSMFQ